MVGLPALLSKVFDEISRLAVNNERGRWWLIMICECVGVLGLKLRNMKNWVNRNSSGELVGEQCGIRL